MEVAADVMNLNDMLLMPKGTVLTARHVRLLKTWGVESLQIVDTSVVAEEEEAPLEMTPEVLDASEKHVAKRFKLITSKLSIVDKLRRMATQKDAQRRLVRAKSIATKPQS